MKKKPRISARKNLRGLACQVSVLLFGAAGVFADPHYPFPAGFSMSTMGAIIDPKGATGSQPWAGAAYYDGPARFGLSAAGMSYYGFMGDSGFSQAAGGAWYSGRFVSCKAAVSYFSAAKTSFEQRVFFSLGTGILRVARLSVEFSGTRMGCAGFPAAYTVGETGFSAFIPWSWAGISLSCEHLVVESAGAQGADPYPTFHAGLHTVRSRFGSQGVLLTVVPDETPGVTFTIAEECRITPRIAFAAALSNNPVQVGAGMTFSLGRSDIGFALVNHPELGWSQGFAADWRRAHGGERP